jgi:hypothetical protein
MLVINREIICMHVIDIDISRERERERIKGRGK